MLKFISTPSSGYITSLLGTAHASLFVFKILTLAVRSLEHQWDNLLTALLRLSKCSSCLPTCLYVTDVRRVQPILHLRTPTTDVFHGIYRGQKVFMKRYRCCSGSLSLEAANQLLIREAVIWANHQHVGVLPFIGVFRREDNHPCESGLHLVSPFFEHGTIVQYLRTNSQANRGLLVRDILSAMAYLHSKKIVHGDIKGANILVNNSGRACVADLGFSRLTEAAVLTWSSIQSTPSLGTYAWQAPERLEAYSVGKAISPTSATDVYSVGCFCYEVFTNRTPFWNVEPDLAETFRPYRIFKEVVKYDRRPLKPEPGSEAYLMRGLSEEIWEIMEACWQRNPSLRPSASQLTELPAFFGIVYDRPSGPV
ncbi:kinase-like protein [Coprinellus micaceus]|uniref:Kinase-like protein n=1 Tax=Coprinellus micaceus TaxID=71717 RepID=A0A4Y7TF32_COPMI|nr:kinase-like protein [Coprinellus micaceus]